MPQYGPLRLARTWLARTLVGRAVVGALERLGVVDSSMAVYARSVVDAVGEPEPPAGVSLATVRASDLAVRPHESFDRLRDSDFVVVARDRSDSVVGWAFVTLEAPVEVAALSSTVRFDGAYVWNLFVEPSARGRGVGSALVEAAASLASRDRVDAAYALVGTENGRSRRAFEANGFEVVDEVTGVGSFERGGHSPPPTAEE